MKLNLKSTSLGLSLVSLFACAGPNFYFDEGPSPDWVRATTKSAQSRQIRMVGASPITTQVQRDLEMAVADAKAKIGQLFVSQVKARSTDWTLSLSGDERQEESQVLNQQVEVRTEIKVEDPTVVSKYRDESTRTQYVALTVDRRKWSSKLDDRISKTLLNITKKIDSADQALSTKNALAAYRDLLQASSLGQEIQADVIVIDLLDPTLGYGTKLNQSRERLADLNKQLRKSFSFYLEVKAANADAGSNLRSALETFLGKFGFELAKQKSQNTIVISVEFGQKFIKKQRVGNRTEFVHQALGQLSLSEPSGTRIPELSFSLPSGGLQEQSMDQDLAMEQALQLAVDSISSKFRSQFRQHFGL